MFQKTSISLDPHLKEFVETQISKGHYGSADDVISAGLHLLEEQEAEHAAIRAALIEGENSGFAEPFTTEELIAELKSI